MGEWERGRGGRGGEGDGGKVLQTTHTQSHLLPAITTKTPTPHEHSRPINRGWTISTHTHTHIHTYTRTTGHVRVDRHPGQPRHQHSWRPLAICEAQQRDRFVSTLRLGVGDWGVLKRGPTSCGRPTTTQHTAHQTHSHGTYATALAVVAGAAGIRVKVPRSRRTASTGVLCAHMHAT